MASDEQRLAQGATNLLLNCAELVAGEKVLVVREPAGLGYYDDEVAEEVGVLRLENIKGGKDPLDASNELRTLFSEPENQCGLGPSGHLEF